MIFITRRAETSYSRSSRYQPPTSITWSISRSASSLVGFLTKPRSCSDWRSASGSLRTAASTARCSSSICSMSSFLVIPKSRKATRPSAIWM